jgi:hypothetical protein
MSCRKIPHKITEWFFYGIFPHSCISSNDDDDDDDDDDALIGCLFAR